MADSEEAFDRIDKVAPPLEKQEWATTIADAECRREVDVSAMDYMKSTLNSGESLTEIQAKLRSDDSKSLTIVPDSGRSTDWLLEGLSIEEAQ